MPTLTQDGLHNRAPSPLRAKLAIGPATRHRVIEVNIVPPRHDVEEWRVVEDCRHHHTSATILLWGSQHEDNDHDLHHAATTYHVKT